uniref:ORF19 n=1 Tax=Nitrosopumilaceae spindle-shaped virus TaxID=3065433 RepID=A0AAT9JAH3_9VIRU
MSDILWQITSEYVLGPTCLMIMVAGTSFMILESIKQRKGKSLLDDKKNGKFLLDDKLGGK